MAEWNDWQKTLRAGRERFTETYVREDIHDAALRERDEAREDAKGVLRELLACVVERDEARAQLDQALEALREAKDDLLGCAQDAADRGAHNEAALYDGYVVKVDSALASVRGGRDRETPE